MTIRNSRGKRPAPPGFTPVPRKHNRHDGWTPERQRAFIEALATTGSVKQAARAVNMSSEGAYYLRRQPGAEEFAAAWNTALDHGIAQLEDIALERALHGIEVPVYSYGKMIGTRRVYNDYLLMFLLRNRAPDRFPEGAVRKRLGQAEDAFAPRPGSEEVLKEIQRKLAQTRERLMNSPEQIAYREWQEARSEGRAVILPQEGEEGEA